jgi:hypothetical protein
MLSGNRLKKNQSEWFFKCTILERINSSNSIFGLSLLIMRNICFLFVLILWNPTIGQSQTVITMKKEGGVSVMPCKVNGLNLSFVFDTGASNVSISMTEALFMIKNGYLSNDDIVGTNKFSDATGSISEGIVINLKEIDIAGIKLYNVEASIVKNPNAPLLLGQSAISKLGKIQLDLVANTLTITPQKNTEGITNTPTHTLENRVAVIDTIMQNKLFNTPTLSIIGNSIKKDSLEIAEHDFIGEMTWDDAKKACALLGDGWRLPTKVELNFIYEHKSEIGGFAAAYYWSSSEFYNNSVWLQFFYNGYQYDYKKSHLSSVRAVRGVLKPLKLVKTNISQNKPLNIPTTTVIGNPIKIGGLEIAEHDFKDKMTWDDAKKACAALGDDWRLPTEEELNFMYEHKSEIGGFAAAYYWCSSNYGSSVPWDRAFFSGDLAGSYSSNADYVRAVRDTSHSLVQNNTTLFVIGKPIKIGLLEIAEHDFKDKMTWDAAKRACAKLGDGWHLPTDVELNELYTHKGEIGGFTAAIYWSSSESANSHVRIQGFHSGNQGASYSKRYTYGVRAVRALKN